MTRDLFNRIKTLALIPPQIETGNTDVENVTTPASVIGAEAAVIEIHTGTLADTDAVFSVKVWEGDDSGGADKAAVAASDLQLDTLLSTVTPEATFQGAFDFSADLKCIKIGYKGIKKYIGLTISPANNSGNAPLSASVVLGNLRVSPAA